MIVGVGSTFAAAGPEVNLGLGLASAALQAGIYLVNFPSGASAAAVQAQVEDLVSKLFLNEGNVFAQTGAGSPSSSTSSSPTGRSSRPSAST